MELRSAATSLVTPAGETRTNTQVVAVKPGSCSHSHFPKHTRTLSFCAEPRAFCIFLQPHFPFFLRTQRKREREREIRAVFRCDRRARSWTSAFSFLFLNWQKGNAAEIKHELIQCKRKEKGVWLLKKKREK